MDIPQIREWIASGQIDAVQEAWMAAAEGEAPFTADEAAEVLAALVAAEHHDVAEALGWALLEERKDRLAPPERLKLAKAMAVAAPDAAELREQALAVYRELFGRHPHFDALVKASELMSAPTPRRALATLDLCLRARDGGYLASRFRNQVLQVRRYDPALHEYELEDLAGGPVALEPRKLADEFGLIEETDFRVLSRRDPERLKTLFFSDPATVLMGVCQSREGRIDSVELKELLVPRYVPADQWSRWWSKARAAAKRCDKLSVEGRNPVFLIYHPEGLSLEAELEADLQAAKTPLAHLELLRRYAREARQRKLGLEGTFTARLTEALARDAGGFLKDRPTDALAASLALDEAVKLGMAAPTAKYPSPAEVLASADEPPRAVAGLEDESLWPAALEALCRLDRAADQLEALLPLTPSRQLDHVARLLRQAGREGALAAAAAKALAEPLEHLELILWLWGEPAEPIPGTAGKLEILSKLLKALHDLDIDMQVAAGQDRKELQRRIRSALGAKDLAVFRQVVGEMDEAMASILKSRIERTDGLAESVRDDMLKVLREGFFGLFAKVKVEPWLEENTLWTTAAALHRCEAELKELVEVRIPANSRAIGEAAAHGDLWENAEWKFAIEERNKLQQRQAKMQDDLAKVRALHPDDVPTNSVGIGSRVCLRRGDNGAQIELSILGPWDSDLEKRCYSYQTALAKVLLGKRIGATVTLKLEGDEAEYTIEQLGVADV
jgi:transcription elongation GreA/GreB family factor